MTTTITWRADAGSSCTFTSGAGAPSGAITTDGNNATFTTPALTSTTTYSVSCTKIGLTASQSATINVVSGTCSTTGATSAISLPGVVASRAIGVAPLSVFFDATGATASTTTRPFHDLEYRWDFGDALGSPVSGTTWAAGSKPGVSSRNSATGPVAAHVFERPGAYTIALTVTDGTNTVSNNCTQITVQDPDVIFKGASGTGPNTICVSSTSTPIPGTTNGCPADALGVQQANFATAINNYAKSGKRVLFKRGDTFTTSTTASVTQTGPGVISSFGVGALPVIQSSVTGFSNTLQFSGRTTQLFSDWRVMDLEFDGMGTTNIHGIGVNGGITQITALRLTMRRFEAALGLDSSMANYWNNSGSPGHVVDQIAIVDSMVVYGLNTHYGAFVGGNRFAFMGNDIDNGGLNVSLGNPLDGSHVARFPYLGKAVISNNSLSRPGFDRHTIKLHGPTWAENGAIPGAAPLTTPAVNYSASVNGDGYSKQVVISDNKLTDFRNPWSINIGPQGAYADERVRDVIIERNLHVGTAYSQVANVIRAREITIRNNLYMGGGATGGQIGVRVEVDGPEPPARNVWIYNNTQYSADAVCCSQFMVVDIRQRPNINYPGINNNAATNFPSYITIKNNLAYAPNATSPVLFANTNNKAGTYATLSDADMSIVVSNNATNAQVKNGPAPFTVPGSMPSVSPPFTVPAGFLDNFRLAGGSYAINAGASVPVWSDFFRTAQSGVPDIGAVVAP